MSINALMIETCIWNILFIFIGTEFSICQAFDVTEIMDRIIEPSMYFNKLNIDFSSDDVCSQAFKSHLGVRNIYYVENIENELFCEKDKCFHERKNTEIRGNVELKISSFDCKNLKMKEEANASIIKVERGSLLLLDRCSIEISCE